MGAEGDWTACKFIQAVDRGTAQKVANGGWRAGSEGSEWFVCAD
ncbi:MAG: hypothetical protein ACTS4W_01405 [Candidatus Hodgkinia cicadicola]